MLPVVSVRYPCDLWPKPDVAFLSATDPRWIGINEVLTQLVRHTRWLARLPVEAHICGANGKISTFI